MSLFLLPSLVAAVAVAAHSLPTLGFLLVRLLLWTYAHAGAVKGFTLLCGTIGAFVGLLAGFVKFCLVFPRLLRRWKR